MLALNHLVFDRFRYGETRVLDLLAVGIIFLYSYNNITYYIRYMFLAEIGPIHLKPLSMQSRYD